MTRNDVMRCHYQKQGRQWEKADLSRTKQNIHRWKGLDESYSKT